MEMLIKWGLAMIGLQAAIFFGFMALTLIIGIISWASQLFGGNDNHDRYGDER